MDRKFWNHINEAFDDTFGPHIHKISGFGGYPSTDFYETEDKFYVQFDVPGVAKEDINLSFNNGSLSISGERKCSLRDKFAQETVEHPSTVWQERSCGKFKRVFQFSNGRNIDTESINARYENGVLTVTADKTGKQNSKDIPIV